METETKVATSDTSARPDHPLETWPLAARIGFRLCVLYFSLYCVLTQIFWSLIPFPDLSFGDPATYPPFRNLVLWTAEHVFRYKQPVIYSGSGSGDKVFDWVLVFCLLVIAALLTLLWSMLDRKRPNYTRLYGWFRVFIRFALAGQMFVYGIVKIFPMQMPFPFLTRLLEPYGNFSPMGALWWSVGASPAYERFVGSMEALAGLLLVVPATSTLGALICFIDVSEIFALNMTFDVPVKLFSFQLLLMSAFILFPERARFVKICFLDCAVGPSTVRKLFASRRANRIAAAAQILFGFLLFGMAVHDASKQWYQYGGGAPKSALYGIWNIDEMSIDGRIRQPLLTDYDRWRRLIFEFPERLTFQRMNDTFGGFGMHMKPKDITIALTKDGDKKWKGSLTIHQQDATHILFDGSLDNHPIRMRVSLLDRNKFTLVNRGFNWVQDYPFNR